MKEAISSLEADILLNKEMQKKIAKPVGPRVSFIANSAVELAENGHAEQGFKGLKEVYDLLEGNGIQRKKILTAVAKVGEHAAPELKEPIDVFLKLHTPHAARAAALHNASSSPHR